VHSHYEMDSLYWGILYKYHKISGITNWPKPSEFVKPESLWYGKLNPTFNISLNDSLMLTSNGCAKEVQPPGIRLLTVISLARKVLRTYCVLYALKRSRIRRVS